MHSFRKAGSPEKSGLPGVRIPPEEIPRKPGRKAKKGKRKMLRTNSKKAIANLKSYIFESTADHIEERAAYENIAVNTSDFRAVSREILREFKEEYYNAYRAPHASVYGVFKEWGSGLVCGGLFDYFIHPARPILGTILEETEEEQARYTEEQAEELLTRLIYREVSKAAE